MGRECVSLKWSEAHLWLLQCLRSSEINLWQSGSLWEYRWDAMRTENGQAAISVPEGLWRNVSYHILVGESATQNRGIRTTTSWICPHHTSNRSWPDFLIQFNQDNLLPERQLCWRSRFTSDTQSDMRGSWVTLRNTGTFRNTQRLRHNLWDNI